jgi:hypothetical protein
MQRALRILRWTVGIVVGLVLGLVGCAYTVLESMEWDPPPSAAAEERERMLVALQPDDLGVEGLRYLNGGSTPGKRAGGGPWKLGADVSAGARYAFDGDPIATCEAVVHHLLALGWIPTDYEEGCADVTHFDAYPDLDVAAHEGIYVSLTFDCVAFPVRGDLVLRMDPTEPVPLELSFQLEAAYPGGEGEPAGGSTTTEPGLLHPACVPAPDR